jgi:hypothetical protein
MKQEIWQTTNQQPWVEALASNLISVKTRTSKPNVPVGATVLLHASKSRLWPHWDKLKWTRGLDSKSWERGAIVAVAIVDNVDWSDKVLTNNEYKFWDVYWKSDDNTLWYNSVAQYAVRFSDIKRLEKPLETPGFQSPYVRAKENTVKAILKTNKGLEQYFN